MNNLRQANAPCRARGGGSFRSDPGSGFVLRFLQLLVLSLLVGVTPLAGAFVITRTSSPVFYIDTSVTPTLQAMYVAYQINNNSGANYADLWVGVDGFTGGSVTPGPTEDGVVHLGSLAPGQTKTAFFYLQAAYATTAAQNHTIRIYPTRPPAGELASQTFSMTVEETIQANANQVETVVAGPNPPLLGGLVTVTVSGRSGTIGASGAMAFNPAAYLSWRADAYELVATTITLSGGNSGTYADTLYLVAGSSSDTAYVGVYTYRTMGTTQTPTPVSPISFIGSGTQIKHTRVDNYTQFDPILSADNKLTLGKTASPTEMSSNGPVTFTLWLANGGAFDTLVEDFVDTLPTAPGTVTYSAGSSRFGGVPIPDPVVSGATLTWIGSFNVPAGGARSLTFQAALPTLNGFYTNRAIAHIGTNQIDTTLPLGDNAPALAIVERRVPQVSGFVYLDANRNLQRDAGEAGSGLSLFAKLVPGTSPAGPALRAAIVDPTTGAYTFTNVPPDIYLILVDNNGTLSDVTPTLPAGWMGTEMPNQIRTNVLVANVNLPDQNFGLIRGTTLSGRVFLDVGSGGGTANDGALNGSEAGLPGAVVRLTDNAGSTTLDTFTTDGAGGYSLFIPAALASGTVIKVVEANPGGYVSVGANVGNTGGSYNRALDTITFTLNVGTSYTNVNFGDVPPNSLVPSGQRSGLPGGVVVHAHTFTAGSAGEVTFLSSNRPNPIITGWTQVLYRDANCNGQLDSTDPVLVNPVPLTSGEQACILVKEIIPLAAPFNAQDVVTITASFTYLGANPALTSSHEVTDLTTVGNLATAGLTLVKSADKATAQPGETITYTILYANTSSDPLRNLVLHDATPAYATFVSATNGPLATNLTDVVINAPAVGTAGAIRWTFGGSLAPGRSGTVTFRVELQQ